ncbi:hypothetical protein JOL79_28220 [Microbispora sp. RL4-1S]|uniref:Secreted protein n=1 Tax=Microbispora oryzae TaxID=2806554 RepID=A0A940WL62_9ACTN|nr:hypothetical protein [Microbispora oryzae]MBP2707675.1 hypothetical protein [Microbispora oryzae]
MSIPLMIAGALLVCVASTVAAVVMVLSPSGSASGSGSQPPALLAGSAAASPEAAGAAGASPDASSGTRTGATAPAAGSAGSAGQGASGGRRPEGTIAPLTPDQDVRDALSAVARASGDSAAAEAADKGTLFYGMVYGATEAADLYYAVTLPPQRDDYAAMAVPKQIDLWSRLGAGGWTYRGPFDPADCPPALPPALYAAWQSAASVSPPISCPA